MSAKLPGKLRPRLTESGMVASEQVELGTVPAMSALV